MGWLLLLLLLVACGCGAAQAAGTEQTVTVSTRKTIRHNVYHAPRACRAMGQKLAGALSKIGSAARGFSGLILPAYRAGLQKQLIPHVIDKENRQSDKIVSATTQVREAMTLAVECFGLSKTQRKALR